jgi:hypothetical protein
MEAWQMTDTAKLEKRIVAARNNPNIGSAELMELIDAVERAAATATTTAEQTRAKAVDLIAAPDAKTAHEAVIVAELTRDRLRAALNPLRDQLTAALYAEQCARFEASYSRGEALVLQEAENFTRVHELTHELVTVFQAAVAVDKEVARINSEAAALSGELRRLRSVELTARGLEQFSRDAPSIMQGSTLPDWRDSARNLWPPPQISMGAAYVASMEFPSHTAGISGPIGPGWETEEARERFRARHLQEQERQQAAYLKMSKEREDRINAEERERYSAAQR